MNAASLEEEDDGVTTGAAGGGGGTLVASPRHAAHSTTRMRGRVFGRGNPLPGQLGFDGVVATRDAFGCFARGDVGGWLSQTTLGTKLDVFDERVH